MFAFVGAGIQVGNTIVAAYVVDAYPLQVRVHRIVESLDHG